MRRIFANLEPGDSSTVRAIVGELALVGQPLSHPAQLLGSRIKEQNMITFSANSLNFNMSAWTTLKKLTEYQDQGSMSNDS